MEVRLNENDIKFIKNVVDLGAKVLKSQKYIKENFNIDSEYDEENISIKLICNNINESLNLLAAKEHIYDFIGEDYIEVVF